MKRTREVTDIESVRVTRTEDGSIQDCPTGQPIQVAVTHYTVTETLDEDGEVIEEDVGPVAEATLKYEFDGGTARMCLFDSTDGGASNAHWTGPDFRDVLPPADEAVANVPDVEDVPPAKRLLGVQSDVEGETDLDE